MKILHQLLFGFLAVVLVFACGGLISVLQLRSIEAANASVTEDSRIHELAVGYERGGREIQLGAYLYAQGNEPMARQLVANGTAQMKETRLALQSALSGSASQSILEIARLDGLALAAVEAVVNRVKQHGNPKLIDRDLQFLESRVEALNLILAGFADATQETAVASLARAQATARRTQQVTLGTLLGSLGLAVSISVWVARRIAGPVKHFTKIAEEVSSGNTNHKLAVTGSGEIGDLATAFGRMINCFKVMESMLNEKDADEAKAVES